MTRAEPRAAPLAAALVVATAVAAVAGCVPSDPAETDEVAVRRTGTGTVEVLPCTDEELRRLTFLTVEDPGEATRREETLWQVEFDPTRQVDEIVLGEVPAGVDESERWLGDGLVDEPDVRFVVRIRQTDGNARAQSFVLADLDDGMVAYGDEILSADEFADEDPCG